MSVRRIFLRRDTAANWSSENPVLSEGEPGFDTTNQILKVGNGTTPWNSLAQFQGPQGVAGPTGATGAQGATGATGATGPQGAEGVSVLPYTTANLPRNGTTGTLAYDTTLQAHVYFKDGKWYRLSDDTLVVDKTINVYLLAGQSNAVGQALLSDLTTAQKAPSDALFYHSRHVHPTNATSTQLYQDTWATEVKAGDLATYTNYTNSTLANQGSDNILRFGPEIGFAKRALDISLNSGGEIGILKYAVGGTSLTNNYGSPVTSQSDWDIDPQYANATTREGDCWRGFKLAIADGLSKLTTEGYTYRLAGMLWWQGENGATSTELNAFIAEVRSHLSTTYTLDTPSSQFPVVIVGEEGVTGGDWGLDFKTNVAIPDSYIGYIDNFAAELHPGGSSSASLRDVDSSGINDMYEMGTLFADKMASAITGTTDGGSATFTPSDLTTTPTVWLDASDSATITHNSNAVSEWADKSGNGYDGTQSTASLQPTYDSANGTISFDTTDAITSTTPTGWNPQDVYIVARWTSGGSAFPNWAGLFCGNHHTGGNIGILGRSGTTNLYGGWANNYFLNGTSTTVNNVFNTMQSDFIMSISKNSTLNLNGFVIGQDRLNTTRGWGGWIGEVVVFNYKLSDADREKVEGYLAHKWSLTSNLPSSHPYKSSAPTP